MIQAIVGFSLLEVVNYMEHYGMLRQKVGVGERQRYERVDPSHSWNSNNIATNVLLYHLQRHSDHHANPTRRYQTLRDFEESPVLPTGYAGMIVLAIVPAVWRRVMDPRVVAHFGGDVTLANISPRKRDRIIAKYGAAASLDRRASGFETVAGAPSSTTEITAEVMAARCPGCGYTYEVARGDEHEGFAAGTAWADVPDSWCCPDCGVREKVDFVPVTELDRAGVMRIEVDRDKCEGLGMCEAMAHEYFELDDDDTMTVARRVAAGGGPLQGARRRRGLPGAGAEPRGLSSPMPALAGSLPRVGAMSAALPPPSRSPTVTGCWWRPPASPPSTAGVR